MINSNKGIKLNIYKRSVYLEDQFCACLKTGTDKVRNGFGNGDCILLDLEHGIFAVADGTERYPQASRSLLKRFINMLSDNELPVTKDEWIQFMNTLFAGQKYHCKTTLSLVFLNKINNDLSAMVIHGGDSVVLFINPKNGHIIYKTDPDMNFAGRSKEINYFRSISFEEDCRIIIVSDGLSDIIKISDLNNKDKIVTFLETYPIHEIPNWFYETLENENKDHEFDDIGLIIIDPQNIKNIENRYILIGGTTAQEESVFQKSFSSKSFDEWIEFDNFLSNPEQYSDIGISIM